MEEADDDDTLPLPHVVRMWGRSGNIVQARRLKGADGGESSRRRSSSRISWVKRMFRRLRPSPDGKAATDDVGSRALAMIMT